MPVGAAQPSSTATSIDRSSAQQGQAVLAHHRMTLEGGDPAGIDLLAVPRHRRRRRPQCRVPLIQDSTTLSPALTLVTAAAGLENRAGAFMTEAMRHPFVLALVAAPLHHLRAAGAGIGDFDQHLAGLQRREFRFPPAPSGLAGLRRGALLAVFMFVSDQSA